jgi:organic hydroperoxide reductase OsmC/OhrA
LDVEAEGTVRKAESGYAFEQIILRPTLTLTGEKERVRANQLLGKAKRLCPVSRAIAVPQVFDPRVNVKVSKGEFVDAAPVK